MLMDKTRAVEPELKF